MKNKAYIIKKVILGILLIFFLFLFIYSGYKIIRWKIDSNKTKKEIKEIH